MEQPNNTTCIETGPTGSYVYNGSTGQTGTYVYNGLSGQTGSCKYCYTS